MRYTLLNIPSAKHDALGLFSHTRRASCAYEERGQLDVIGLRGYALAAVLLCPAAPLDEQHFNQAVDAPLRILGAAIYP